MSLPLSAATDETKTRQQLEQLQGEITRINHEISSATARKNTLLEQLKEAEINLGKLQGKILANEAQQQESAAKLIQFKEQKAALELARDQQQLAIAKEIKSAYQMGRQGQVKVLLSQQEPDTVARLMAYYGYFLEQRTELLTRYRETLNEIATLEIQITGLVEQLATTVEELKKERASLALAQQSREQAVANLAASIAEKGGALKQKQADQLELQKLLEAIEIAVANLQVPDDYKAFTSARGKMPWPVSGKSPINHYGKFRNEGKMLWQGISMPAREGTPVRAIHHGRVVYADWFRGSGLLLIIDHGEGYMSLYAHNQTLMHNVGEWVTAGTQVSTVGSSGGLESAALYFEIRHRGKPTNPGTWCQG